MNESATDIKLENIGDYVDCCIHSVHLSVDTFRLVLCSPPTTQASRLENNMYTQG